MTANPAPEHAGQPLLARRARSIRLLVLDVDGVLTDGRLYLGAGGETLKVFDVRDGLGLEMWRRAGLVVAVISGRCSEPLLERLRELQVEHHELGVADKGPAFERLLARVGLPADAVAAIGDDLPDLPVLTRAGVSFAPADAAEPVKRAADVVLTRAGGQGCVREAVELLLRARGDWDGVVSAYLGG